MEPTPSNTTGENNPILNAPPEVIIKPNEDRSVPSVALSVPSVVQVDDTLNLEEVAMGANGVNPDTGVNPTQANGDKPTPPVSEVGLAEEIENKIITQLQANKTN